MSRHCATHVPIHCSLMALTLALAMAGAATALQVAPANPPVAEAGQAAATAEDSSQSQKGQTGACSRPGPESVKVLKVRLVPPLKETAIAKAEGAESPQRTSSRCGACTKKAALPIVELQDTIAVKLQNLTTLLDYESCLGKDDPARTIVLYLDRRPLKNLVADPPADPEQGELMFRLTRTDDSKEVWTHLLGRPKPFKDREVEVSVGIDDEFAVPSEASLCLRVIPRGWFSFWLLTFAALAVGFVVLALRCDVLRDPVTAPTGARPPYSLSRVQAAWWLFLVLASYLLIGMVTGDFSNSITGTVLTLLGISAGTAAGAAFVDASKNTLVTQAQDAARASSLKTELQTLDTEIDNLSKEVQTPAGAAKANELAAKQAVSAAKWSTYRKLTNESESFLLDILSDTNGVNFHRFQILAWTVILGIIFVGQVYRELAMPQFDETLLGLMGISAITYIGLKIPENQSSGPTTPNATPPPK